MRKQLGTNPNSSGNYSPIGISSMNMSYHGSGVGATSGVSHQNGGPASPTTYVLPSQSLPEASYSASPQRKWIPLCLGIVCIINLVGF